MKNKLWTAALVTVTALMLGGCTADEYMNVVTTTEPQQNQSEATGDEVTRLLTEAGFGDVRIEDVKYGDTDDEGTRYYFFTIEQPISHHNKSLGTYKQHACLRATDLTAPVLLYTHGYEMPHKATSIGADHVARALEASELHVEHRYFDQSLPESHESLAFTYLNADEAAHDLDSLLVRLQRTVLKNSKHWVSTGTSKDGMTTALLAYYADKYGWTDKTRSDYFRMDVYVPFCAPFLTGTPESCDDPQIGYYLYFDCGNGYEAGSAEEQAYRRLRKIPEAIVTNKNLREACLRYYHYNNPDNYVEIIQKYGLDEEKVTCGLVNIYMANLFGKFSYVPFKEWASMVPDIDTAVKDLPADIYTPEGTAIMNAIGRVAAFVMMNAKALDATIKQNQYQTYGSNALSAQTVADPHTLTDAEILENLQAEVDFPYYIQAVKELGQIRFDFSMLDGVMFSEASTQDMGYLTSDISKLFEISTMLAKYADQWDGGRLMTDFRDWAVNRCTANMVYVYAENDPWTGGAIDTPNLANVKRFIFKNTVHNDYLFDSRYFSEDDAATVKNAINAFLK